MTESIASLPRPNDEIEWILRNNAVVAQAWRQIREEYQPDVCGSVWVSYLSQFLAPLEPLLDARNKKVGDLRAVASRDVGVFFDPEHSANWQHRCWIAIYHDLSQELQVAQHEFPPQETDSRRLVVLEVIDVASGHIRAS